MFNQEEYKKLSDTLDDEIKKHSGPLQGSDEWFELSKKTIGGSEIGTLIKNPYKSKLQLALSKIKKPEKFQSFFACSWGKLFEDVFISILQIIFGHEIKGTNVCLVKDVMRYSPDGFVVLRTCDEKIYTTDMDSSIETILKIILLELKCPISRVISEGKIPSNYYSQVQMGVSMNTFVDFGLYCEAVFRKCSFNDLGNNVEYDKELHNDNYENQPIAWSMIGVYIEDDDIDFLLHQCRNYLINQSKLIDIGILPKSQFHTIINMIDQTKLSIEIMPPCFNDGRGINLHTRDERIQAVHKYLKKSKKIIGIISWKLFELNFVNVNRDEEFLTTAISLINVFNENVSNALNSDNPENFLRELYKN